MPRPGLSLRSDYNAETCRRLAAGVKDVRQARRLLSLAAAYDGMSRAEAARIGGMGRQTLRDRCPAGYAKHAREEGWCVSMLTARMPYATWRALADLACWMQISCISWPRSSGSARILKPMVSFVGAGLIFAG